MRGGRGLVGKIQLDAVSKGWMREIKREREVERESEREREREREGEREREAIHTERQWQNKGKREVQHAKIASVSGKRES